MIRLSVVKSCRGPTHWWSRVQKIDGWRSPVLVAVAPVSVSVATVNFVVLGMKSSKLTAADEKTVEDGWRPKGKRPVGRPRKLKRSDTAGETKHSVKREKKSDTAGETKRSKKASSLAVAETVFGDKLSKDGARMRRKKKRKKTTESSSVTSSLSVTTLRSVVGDGDKAGKGRKTRRKKRGSVTQRQN